MPSIKDGVYILGLDAKDIYLANYNDSYTGYNPRNSVGNINTDKFLNKLDYSLDLLKLIDVYKTTYRNNRLTFEENGKSYSQRVINVTFKYSVKEYNRCYGDIWVKFGYDVNSVVAKMKDHIYIEDGVIIAIDTKKGVENPLSKDKLGRWFHYDPENKKYSVYEYKLHTIKNVKQLRDELYSNGFYCDGIRFVRFKRSSGSARVGKCLFIDENLYPRMHKWELCKLKINEGDEVDLAALEAYISLTLSSIIDTIEIDPKSILVIDDYESEFDEDVIETTLDDGKLVTKPNRVTLKNSIWDGQSLMDISLFGKYQNKGMLLLRNQFFKSCCFNCNIQKWFKDNGITSLEQLNGKTIADDISQIKLITTPSSIKYLKFGTLKKWLREISPTFGVVKYEKKTHYLDGKVVRCHYQLINSLQMTKKEVEELARPSLEYLNLIKSDPAVLRHFIRYSKNVEIEEESLIYKNDIVYKLLGLNNEFSNTKMYAMFLEDTVKAYRKNLKEGHLFVNGNYSTLCGNPIEMLQHSIGLFEGKSQIGIGKVHTTRFKYNKTLLGSRSPHICQCNIWLPLNSSNKEIDKYMNTTDEIVYINSIKESVLDKLSGSDFDSDSLLLTDNSTLIKAGRRNYSNFKVSVNNVEAKKIKRFYTSEQKSHLDYKTSNNQIGVIINLSQELNSKVWHKLNNGATIDEIQNIYYDTCQLNIMSNIEIDAAKKEFDVVMNKEIGLIRDRHKEETWDFKVIKPYFFGVIARNKGFYDSKKFKYSIYDTSMDYLESVIQNTKIVRNEYGKKITPFHEILNISGYENGKVNRRQVARIIMEVKKFNSKTMYIYGKTLFTAREKNQYYFNERDKIIKFIGEIKLNGSTIIYLLRKLDTDEYQKFYKSIVRAFFSYPNTSFYDFIKTSKQDIGELVYDEHGDIKIFGYSFSKKYKNLE